MITEVDALAQVKELLSVRTPRPIADAPKDGKTYILVFGPRYVSWKSAVWNRHFSDWADGLSCIDARVFSTATHWMPMPPAPTDGAE